MKQRLFIGDLSRQFNIPAQTIRYYERIGLIDPPERTESQYRVYSEEDVDRLRFILQAKRFGLSLDEIKELIQIRTDGTAPCEHLKTLIKQHMDDLDKRIQQMVDFRNELAHRFQKLQETQPDECSDGTICKVIEQEPLN